MLPSNESSLNPEFLCKENVAKEQEGPVKVFIGRIPGPCTEKDLVEYFS